MFLDGREEVGGSEKGKVMCRPNFEYRGGVGTLELLRDAGITVLLVPVSVNTMAVDLGR